MSLFWLIKLSVQKQTKRNDTRCKNGLWVYWRGSNFVVGRVREGGKKVSWCPVSCIEVERRSWWDLCLPSSVPCSLIDWMWPSVARCSLSCLAHVRPVCPVFALAVSLNFVNPVLKKSKTKSGLSCIREPQGWVSSRYKLYDCEQRY